MVLRILKVQFEIEQLMFLFILYLFDFINMQKFFQMHLIKYNLS